MSTEIANQDKVHSHLCKFCDLKAIHLVKIKVKFIAQVCAGPLAINTSIIEVEEPELCDEPIQIVCAKIECQLRLKLETYQWKLAQAEKNIEAYKVEIDAFRILMLKPETMEDGVEKGKYSVFNSTQWVSSRGAMWEDKMSFDTQLIFLDLFTKVQQKYAEIVGKQATKLKIKKELFDKSSKETAKVNEIRENRINGDGSEVKEPRVKLSDYDKAVNANIKNFKVTKEIAEQMVQAMGMKK